MLYLIRHAHALDSEDDAARPLSPRGKKQVEALAKLLHGTDAFYPEKIWHSPLVRARETADLLVRGLGRKLPLVETAGLRPDDDPAKIARALKHVSAPLCVVGHEPHLSALASLLVIGAEDRPVFLFKKCAVLALDHVDDHWLARWQVSPELLG